MARAPMKLDLKKNQMHKDLEKAPGAKVTEADIAKEKSKGGAHSLPRTPRSGITPQRGNGSERLAASTICACPDSNQSQIRTTMKPSTIWYRPHRTFDAETVHGLLSSIDAVLGFELSR